MSPASRFLALVRPPARLILQVALLTGFWKAGLWLSPHLPVPLPGTLVGMALLFLALQLGLVKPAWIEDGAAWLFRHMLLFFIPAAIGVVSFPELLGGAGLRAVGVIAASTAAVMLVTAAAVEWVGRRRAGAAPGQAGEEAAP